MDGAHCFYMATLQMWLKLRDRWVPGTLICSDTKPHHSKLISGSKYFDTFLSIKKVISVPIYMSMFEYYIITSLLKCHLQNDWILQYCICIASCMWLSQWIIVMIPCTEKCLTTQNTSTKCIHNDKGQTLVINIMMIQTSKIFTNLYMCTLSIVSLVLCWVLCCMPTLVATLCFFYSCL